MNMNTYKGMVVVELMVVISIAAILISITTPSFRGGVVKFNAEIYKTILLRR